MSYWVYVYARSTTGTIHRESCGVVQKRAEEDWHGPYATKGAAYDAVEVIRRGGRELWEV